MLIMPATDVNFQALAENIANDFFSSGTPLSDGIVKTAKEHNFTPEEVTRLVEKTNTAASLHLLKTAEDKKGTFTLAQLGMVLRETHPTEEAEKTASVYTGIPHTRRSEPALEKAASVAEPVSYDEPVTAAQAVFTLRRALDEKKLEKLALEQRVQDRIDYLASEFNTWNGPDFTKYAAECQHVYGKKCEPVLQGLAKYLRADLTKTASVENIVDDTTPRMQAMQTICTGLETLIKLGGEISHLEERLGTVWQALKVAL